MSDCTRFAAVVADLAYPGLHFVLDTEDWWLRVVADEDADSVTGEPYAWKGRKWRLSPHMTDGEIVQTALKAVLTALEHEAREKFTFRGVALFGPHFDLYRLLDFARDEQNHRERDP